MFSRINNISKRCTKQQYHCGYFYQSLYCYDVDMSFRNTNQVIDEIVSSSFTVYIFLKWFDHLVVQCRRRCSITMLGGLNISKHKHKHFHLHLNMFLIKSLMSIINVYNVLYFYSCPFTTPHYSLLSLIQCYFRSK